MTKRDYILNTARELYLKRPFWKRWQFVRWMLKNGWDVEDVYMKCVREAALLANENNRYKHLWDGDEPFDRFYKPHPPADI